MVSLAYNTIGHRIGTVQAPIVLTLRPIPSPSGNAATLYIEEAEKDAFFACM